MIKKKSSLGNRKIVILIIALLLAILAGLVIYMAARESNKTCTTYNGSVEKQCAEDYIGLSQDAATARAKEHSYTPLVVSIDGKAQGVLSIGGPLIHFKITNGKVSEAYFEE